MKQDHIYTILHKIESWKSEKRSDQVWILSYFWKGTWTFHHSWLVVCLFVCCSCCRCSSWSPHPTPPTMEPPQILVLVLLLLLLLLLLLPSSSTVSCIYRSTENCSGIQKYISLEFSFFATTALVTKARNSSQPFDNSSTKNKRRERERESMEEHNSEREREREREEQLH